MAKWEPAAFSPAEAHNRDPDPSLRDDDSSDSAAGADSFADAPADSPDEVVAADSPDEVGTADSPDEVGTADSPDEVGTADSSAEAAADSPDEVGTADSLDEVLAEAAADSPDSAAEVAPDSPDGSPDVDSPSEEAADSTADSPDGADDSPAGDSTADSPDGADDSPAGDSTADSPDGGSTADSPDGADDSPAGDSTADSPDGAAAPAGDSTADSPDGAAAPSRRRRRGRKKARRSWPERILLTAVIIVVLAIVGMGVGYGYVKYRFDQVTKVAVKHLKVAAVGQPFNMLVIGSDSRANDNSSDVAHLGPTTGGQRSDVVKIVHVDPATGQIRVLSIPRDTVVTVAGDTSQIGQYNRINSTYDTGPDQLVQTIEANFGIPISHVVQVNFEGFRGAVDAIGGINLNFPVPAKDDYTGLNITQAGCQHLNGGYSLAVARSRHYQYFENGYWQTDGTSDFGRIQRQNAFLKALITQAESRYNPLTLNAFIGAVVQGVTIDNTFTTAGLIDLAREFHAFSSSSLATATLPTYSDLNSSTFAGLGDVLYVQQPDTQQAITQFLGQPPETATTPPPDPDGNPTTVPTTIAATGTTAPGQTTTPASSTTTTTIPNFDPTPC